MSERPARSSEEIVSTVLRSIREPSEAAVDAAMTKHKSTIAESDTERARADFRRKFRAAIDAMGAVVWLQQAW